MPNKNQFDVLIIGSGAAGLMSAIQLTDKLSIAVIAKDKILEGSSYYAQGGISAVLDPEDDFESHISDTINTGFNLGNEDRIRFMVEQSPIAISDLENAGVNFSLKGKNYDLTTEGGHSSKRVAHVDDKTGQSIQVNLLAQVKQRTNITLFEQHLAVDLLINEGECNGAFIFDKKTKQVTPFISNKTILATGGASKSYLYTSNPDTSTGDGIAMAYRAGCEIVNMEFTQFHPTCLFHPHAKSFLISETLRGEGAKLLLPNGKEFMHNYDERLELAPRDIVARAIDHEMKVHGFECVYLDISFKDSDWISNRFPAITERCKELGLIFAVKLYQLCLLHTIPVEVLIQILMLRAILKIFMQLARLLTRAFMVQTEWLAIPYLNALSLQQVVLNILTKVLLMTPFHIHIIGILLG